MSKLESQMETQNTVKDIYTNKIYNGKTQTPKNVKNISSEMENLFYYKEILELGTGTIDDIHKMINEYENIGKSIPRKSKAHKVFITHLRSIKNIDMHNAELYIETLFSNFNNLKEFIKTGNQSYITFNKPKINIYKKKSYVIDYCLKNIDNEFEVEKSKVILERVQKSNDKTPIIYTTIHQRHYEGSELIDFLYEKVKDYKIHTGKNVQNLVGVKTESTIQTATHNVISHFDYNNSNRVLLPFLGGSGDLVNVFPYIQNKSFTLILGVYEKTPYQSYIDMIENTQELIYGVRKLEVEFIKETKNGSKKHKIKPFLDSKVEELNELEEQGIHDIGTSILYWFLHSKSFGSNLEWKNNISSNFGFSDAKSNYNKNFRSVISNIEYGKWIIEEFESVEILNCSYEYIYKNYNEETDIVISDPVYKNARTTYGTVDFDHEGHLKLFLEHKSKNKIYFNYEDTELIEMSKKYPDVECSIVKKLVRNGREPIDGEELIISRKINHSNVSNNTTFQPLKQVS